MSERTEADTSTPPDGLPTYRVLTGPDDEAFCRRVSEMLALGYELHQGPAATFNGERVILAQALVWPTGRLPSGK
jgi:hypothetical protein